MFGFIGIQSDKLIYMPFDNKSFDNDHEWSGSWTSGQILDGLNGLFSDTGSPGVVLLTLDRGDVML